MSDSQCRRPARRRAGRPLFARNDASIQVNHNVWEQSGFLPIQVGRRPGQGYSNIGFTGNRVWRDGTLQPFEKPGGTNDDLFGLE